MNEDLLNTKLAQIQSERDELKTEAFKLAHKYHKVSGPPIFAAVDKCIL